MRQLGRRSVGLLPTNPEKKAGILKPWGDWSRKDSAQRGRPAAPDQADRTAGGVGGAAPASLDLYGQSRIISCLNEALED